MPLDLQILIVLLTGLVLGSFTTALSWREGRGESWVNARSRCPSCETVLGLPDLIPLFSWLIFRGKCRHCGKPIGLRYPLTELLILAGCLGIYIVWHFTVPAFILMAALPFMAALILIDIDQMILPDRLNIILFVLGIVFVASLYLLQYPDADPWLLPARAGAAVVYALMAWMLGRLVTLLLKKEALGFGDVKFFGVAGFWLGLSWLPGFMMLAGVMGLLWGAGWRLAKGNPLFPFGPSLILALYAGLLLKGLGIGPVFGL